MRNPQSICQKLYWFLRAYRNLHASQACLFEFPDSVRWKSAHFSMSRPPWVLNHPSFCNCYFILSTDIICIMSCFSYYFCTNVILTTSYSIHPKVKTFYHFIHTFPYVFLTFCLKPFYCLFYYSCLNFFPLPPSTQPTIYALSVHSVVRAHGSFTHVLWLTPPPFFCHPPLLLLQRSVCTMFPCLWFCFAH